MPEPLVAILMGSDSDLGVMEKAARALGALGVEWEMRCISAHRDPGGLHAYVADAEARGVRLFICGAGGAAHLPGVVASLTARPVIGVPCTGWALAGADSLYSIVQMPPGVPVATVGIDAGQNAGLLAAQMLALADADLAERLAAHKVELRAQNADKDRRVAEAAARLREHGA